MDAPSARETLLQLLELSRLDAELFEARRRQRDEPAALQAELDAQAAAAAGLEQDTSDLKQIQKTADQLNLQARCKAEDVEKLRGQLRIVKTNKEYATINRQIQDLHRDQSELETKVLEQMLQIDEARARQKARREALEVEKRRLAERRPAVERALAELGQAVGRLEAQRARLTEKIDPELLGLYERVLARRGDRGMINADEGICQACYMQLTPQEYNLVLLAHELVICKSCGRILYIEERLQSVRQSQPGAQATAGQP